MYGRFYSAIFDEVAVTAVSDLFELICPSDAVLVIHTIDINQSSDAGDAESEQLHFDIKRATGSYTTGSGGTTPNATKHATGDAASGATVKVNNTTQAANGSGSIDNIFTTNENVMAGLSVNPPPEQRIILSPGEALIISMDAPADSLTLSGRVVFEEIGG